MKTIKWVLILLFLSLTGISPRGVLHVKAADPQQDVSSHVTYTFGSEVTFNLELPAESEFRGIQVFFREESSTNTRSAAMQINDHQAHYILDLHSIPLTPFHTIAYWFSFTGLDGKETITNPSTFFYDDNRFDWQRLEDGLFKVHWYVGDIKFGQSVLDVARAALDKAGGLINFSEPSQIDIYVYASAQDLQSALQLGDVSLIAGHADPALGVMVVSLPEGPAQRMEIGRQVPHELMHILLYSKLGNRYINVPTWLNEGLASNNEELPNPDYFVVLEDAVKKQSLIDFSTLCSGFPIDAASFYQSYAQSNSFVYYLYQNFGQTKMNQLLEVYADGVGCARAPLEVLEKELNTLESNWQAELGGIQGSSASGQFITIIPWIIVLGLLLSGPIILAVVQLLKPLQN